MLQSLNPFTGELISEYKELSNSELIEKLDLAEKTFKTYRKTSFEQREACLMKLASLLERDRITLATLITNEIGKLFKESLAEIDKCQSVCIYYAQNGSDFLKDDHILSTKKEAYLSYAPIGCVLAVMPWNFPFWQVFRFLAPTLMSGNVGLLKHASNVMGVAKAIEKLALEAGFNAGVFQSLLISSSAVETVIKHKSVKAITLTGSEGAGAAVASVAGHEIKKTVLELGGSDPFIVLEDADLDHVTNMAIKARFLNCGQSCIAAKRFLIPKRVRNEFLGLLIAKVECLKVGDPMDESTDLGPMARKDLLLELDRQVDESVSQGAVVISGGAAIDEDKCLYMPTILAEVVKGMPAYDNELFGPVMSVIYYNAIEDAVEIANDTPYGLGASIWTKDIDKAKNIAKEIDSGAVFINEMVSSSPELPFGGTKLSGYGRELSYLGIREFVNIKTIVVG